MLNNNIPFCSVIVLNYFGEKVIEETIRSLEGLNYPKEKFEIIIVDNNSQDKSRKIIKQLEKKYANIKSIFIAENLGFARGNNIGIKKAKGEYVVLLNNDCIVDRMWLRKLVSTAKKDPAIFAVNSKILLFPKFIKILLSLKEDIVLQEVVLEKSKILEFLNPKDRRLTYLKLDDCYEFEIPYSPLDKNIGISLMLHTKWREEFNKYRLTVKNLPQKSYSIFDVVDKEEGTVCEVEFDVSQIAKESYDKVQNAGIIVFQDGAGRDIGANIYYSRQSYERDSQQYQEGKEVYAACGAAVMYKKSLLDEIGYLDGNFFMYYEDVEVSERARLNGYKTVYCPEAIVRHLHAFSSKEWSGFFLYHAEKGRLLHTFFHFPMRVFIKEFFSIFSKIAFVLLLVIKGLIRPRKIIFFTKDILASIFGLHQGTEKKQRDIGKVMQYIKVIFYFMLNFHTLLFLRLSKHKGLQPGAIQKNYNEIIKGKWYFD